MDIRKTHPVEHFIYWTTTTEGLEQAEMSAQSVRRCHPYSRIFVYTSQPGPLAWADVVEHQPDTWPLMLANLVAQAHYMLTYASASPAAFLDTDILLTRRLCLPGSVDLAVTFREYVKKDGEGKKIEGLAKDMPYNYGVVLANPTMAAAEAFLWLRDRIRRMNPQAQAWYGNQMALRELVGLDRGRTLPYITIRELPFVKLTVKVLDAESWNYTPEGPDEPLTGRRVLHLKGKRKGLMPHYLERILREAA